MTEKEWVDIFSRNLNELMQEYGYNQYDFAEEMGVSQSAVSHWLTGRRAPSVFSIVNMAYVLDVDINDLIDFGSCIEC